MKRSAKVHITGNRCFTGTVLAVTDIAMVIQEMPGCMVTGAIQPAPSRCNGAARECRLRSTMPT